MMILTVSFIKMFLITTKHCLCLSLCSRFGSLIEVHLVPGRKVGYMKYAEKQVTLNLCI